MSQTKSVTIFGLALEIEASYAGGGTIVLAEDGHQLREEVVAQITPLNDGARANPPGSGTSFQKRTDPSGKRWAFQPEFEFRGAGAAYAASVFAPELHRILRFCGYDAALDVGVGTEKYTYTPAAMDGSPASGFGDAYARGQKWPLTGLYGSLDLDVQAGGHGIIRPNLRAIAGQVADAALPAITYSTVDPPKAESMGITIGNYTGGVVRSLEFRQNRQIDSDRTDANAAGADGGIAIGRRGSTLVAVIEADDLEASSPFHAAAAIDPYRMFETSQEVALAFTLGSVQYNRLKFSAAQAQLSEYPSEESDGPTGLWRLTFQLNPSTPDLDDDHQWVTD